MSDDTVYGDSIPDGHVPEDAERVEPGDEWRLLAFDAGSLKEARADRFHRAVRIQAAPFPGHPDGVTSDEIRTWVFLLDEDQVVELVTDVTDALGGPEVWRRIAAELNRMADRRENA